MSVSCTRIACSSCKSAEAEYFVLHAGSELALPVCSKSCASIGCCDAKAALIAGKRSLKDVGGKTEEGRAEKTIRKLINITALPNEIVAVILDQAKLEAITNLASTSKEHLGRMRQMNTYWLTRYRDLWVRYSGAPEQLLFDNWFDQYMAYFRAHDYLVYSLKPHQAEDPNFKLEPDIPSVLTQAREYMVGRLEEKRINVLKKEVPAHFRLGTDFSRINRHEIIMGMGSNDAGFDSDATEYRILARYLSPIEHRAPPPVWISHVRIEIESVSRIALVHACEALDRAWEAGERDIPRLNAAFKRELDSETPQVVSSCNYPQSPPLTASREDLTTGKCVGIVLNVTFRVTPRPSNKYSTGRDKPRTIEFHVFSIPEKLSASLDANYRVDPSSVPRNEINVTLKTWPRGRGGLRTLSHVDLLIANQRTVGKIPVAERNDVAIPYRDPHPNLYFPPPNGYILADTEAMLLPTLAPIVSDSQDLEEVYDDYRLCAIVAGYSATKPIVAVPTPCSNTVVRVIKGATLIANSIGGVQ